MILPFSEKFPWGEPTLFEEKLTLKKTWETKDMYVISNGYPDFEPKIHTIRKDLAGRWRAGRSVQGFYNSRTKNMRKIFDGHCYSTQSIEIIHEPNYCEQIGSYPVVLVQWKDVEHPCLRQLDIFEIEKLAINDGFKDTKQFFKWFSEDFKGKIIHFTDFKY